MTKREILAVLEPSVETINTTHPDGPRGGEFVSAVFELEILVRALKRDVEVKHSPVDADLVAKIHAQIDGIERELRSLVPTVTAEGNR